ncbi:VOC family protein [Aquimarina sp. Aq107]|uniref:VOC family protein n=1 Tax=Aquimarina sp. Aq107 TaxID=1191912 RepID=UPI000D5615BB|nr:VOC family protein [Aquimarina sp. Aq107]
MKNVNPVNWFDINVSNLNNAKNFYETVFNIKLVDFPIEFGKQSGFPFDPKGSNITGALVEKEDFVPNSNNTIIYFESQDCITEESVVEKAGGKIIRPKMPIGEFGFVSILMDIDGNTIGLHSRE